MPTFIDVVVEVRDLGPPLANLASKQLRMSASRKIFMHGNGARLQEVPSGNERPSLKIVELHHPSILPRLQMTCWNNPCAGIMQSGFQ
jgi:hypothetical protein